MDGHPDCFAVCMLSRALTGFIIATLLSAGAAVSQTPPRPSDAVLNEADVLSHEGQVVSLVELTGRPDLDTELYRQLIPIHPGERLSRARIVEAIDALRNTHRFDDVQVELKPELDGVRVAFVLQPAFYVGLYQFPGAERFSYGLMIQVSRFSAQQPYSPADIKQAQEALLTYFRQNGYFQSRVEAEVRPDAIYRLANVDFKTTLGPRARFGEVLIEGASPEDARRIHSFLRSFRARLRMAAVRPGRTYSQRTLQNATRRLESRLADDTHPVVQVMVTGASYNPQTNRADVTFSVNRSTVIPARLEGAQLSRRVERKLLPAYPESGLSPELIQDGRQNLLTHFRQKGYFEVKVNAIVEEEDGEKTVIYQISRGPRQRIREIEFRGNTHFSQEELRPHLAARKAHFLNRGRYDETTSVRLLTAFYQSQGFNAVTISPRFVSADGTDVILVLEVNEGPRDIVEDLQIQGNTVPIATLAPAGLRLGPGMPFSQSAMEQDRSKLLSSYLEMGYLTATLHQSSQPLSSAPNRFQVLYEIMEGPQVSTGNVVTLGRNRTNQTLIDRDVAGIRPGVPIRESELFASESRLFARGVFDWSQVNLRRRITSQDQEDVIVKVHEAKRNSITYGFGFQMTNRGGNVPSGRVTVPGLPTLQLPSTFVTNEETIAGPRASFQYARSNVRGRAETLAFGALYGPLERTVEFDFINPHFRWTNWRAVVEAAADYNKQNPLFTSRQVLGTFQLERPLDKRRQQSLILRYSLSRLNLTNLEIPELVPPKDRNTRLSTFSAAYIRDSRDSAVDPHKGAYVSFEVDENPRIFGSNTTFTRLLAQGTYYQELKPAWIWANSVRAGLLAPTNGEDIPISQRFFTGGGSTLRGFPLNGAGPQRAVPACSNPSDPSTCSLIEVPVGGVQLLIINSEFRMPLPLKKGLGVAVFYDGGNVFDPSLSNHSFNLRYTNSVGVGFRYSTPIGPIRVDIGRNLNPVPGINPTQLFITLGQAF
jgi:outer membrane protein insertion porin family